MLMNEPYSWRFDPDQTAGPRAGLERYTQPILCSLDLSPDESQPPAATHFVEVRAWPDARDWQWELEVDVADHGLQAHDRSPEFAAHLANDVLVPFMLSWRADVEGGVHEACPGLAEHIARASALNHDGSCTVRMGERDLATAFALMRRA